jgi:hypothetical protein
MIMMFKSKMRKGVLEMVTELPTKILLVIILFGVMLIILINTGGILAWFNCGNEDFKYGFGRGFCPEEVYDEDYLIAKESTEQLICAIESTIEGADEGCFKKEEAVYGDVFVECKFAGEPTLSAEPSTWQNFKDFFKNIFSKEENVPYGCRVYNYNLPQEVDNAEQWIAGYGDPKFLSYYESFPLGEDRAWSGYATWMENVGTVVLFAMPVGSIVSGGKKWVSGTISSLKDSVKTKTLLGIDKLFTKLGWSKDKITVMMFEEGISQVAKREAYQTIGQRLLSTLSSDQIRYGMNAAKKTTPLAFISACLDSINEKYVRYSNKMILKQPYYEVKPWGINGKKLPLGLEFEKPNNLPIVLDKQGVINDYLDKDLINFYLASPCEADLMVERSTVYCSSYEYSPTKGLVCGYEDMSDACVGAIEHLEQEGRSPTIDIPLSKCTGISSALDHIPTCGNDDNAKFDVTVGAIIGTSNVHCLTTAIKIKTISQNGFCYAEPSKATVPVFVSTLVADGLLTYFSAGTLTQVAVGLTGGVLYVTAQQYENWP